MTFTILSLYFSSTVGLDASRAFPVIASIILEVGLAKENILDIRK